jgi:hypothetical protein
MASKKGKNMIAVFEKKPKVEIHSACEANLAVQPSDISFQDLPGGSVLIRVKVRNDGMLRSEPTLMGLESAPLGAFVPWRPLAELVVPALNPGEAIELSTEAARFRPATLGSFDRVPPKTLLTAINASPDETALQAGGGLAAMFNFLRGKRTVPNRAVALAPDMWEIVEQEQPHWAGNIHVFLGARDVERHMSKELRIYPGRINMAMFTVGGLKGRDAYAFDLVGLSPGWQARLFDVSNAKTLVPGYSDKPIQEIQWVQSAGSLMITLEVRPPADCKQGGVEVHVTQQSSLKKAVVEFELDPAARGKGCYVA